MPVIEFSDLPEDLRVKLTEDAEEELWHRINEFGGIRKFTEHFEYSSSKLYNWKNKNSFLPVKFVKRLMGGNYAKGIKAIKGKGRSKQIQGLNFPLEVSDELMTRVEASVSVNSDGIPTYITDERSLMNRFTALMDELGEVSYTVYTRESRYEIRYPKFLHEVFDQFEFETGFAALVDEDGLVEDGKLKASGKEVSIEKFSGELYSREKKFELALERGDEDVIRDIIGGEASKVESLLNN